METDRRREEREEQVKEVLNIQKKRGQGILCIMGGREQRKGREDLCHASFGEARGMNT